VSFRGAFVLSEGECWKCCSAFYFILFHESTEVKKDVSLMNGQENRKHGGYGNEGSLCDAFLLFRDNAELSFSSVPLKDRESDEETCVDGSGNVW